MELALEILKESLHFHEFCLQEPCQVLTVKTSENSPHTSSREREKATISKYAQSILFSLQSPGLEGNYFIRA